MKDDRRSGWPPLEGIGLVVGASLLLPLCLLIGIVIGFVLPFLCLWQWWYMWREPEFRADNIKYRRLTRLKRHASRQHRHEFAHLRRADALKASVRRGDILAAALCGLSGLFLWSAVGLWALHIRVVSATLPIALTFAGSVCALICLAVVAPLRREADAIDSADSRDYWTKYGGRAGLQRRYKAFEQACRTQTPIPTWESMSARERSRADAIREWIYDRLDGQLAREAPGKVDGHPIVLLTDTAGLRAVDGLGQYGDRFIALLHEEWYQMPLPHFRAFRYCCYFSAPCRSDFFDRQIDADERFLVLDCRESTSGFERLYRWEEDRLVHVKDSSGWIS